jgi:hypothetical protein
MTGMVTGYRPDKNRLTKTYTSCVKSAVFPRTKLTFLFDTILLLDLAGGS